VRRKPCDLRASREQKIGQSLEPRPDTKASVPRRVPPNAALSRRQPGRTEPNRLRQCPSRHIGNTINSRHDLGRTNYAYTKIYCMFWCSGVVNTTMLAFIVLLLIIGLIAGALARLLVPGRDPIGLIGTIVLGIVGSFVGGFISTLVEYHTLSVHAFHLTGIIWSIVGAIVVLVLLRLFHAEPGRGRSRSRRHRWI
jgi:uncharacterized membrane protein YeaQ/YmgE (transglycosylase-associated protein family)